MRKLVFMVTILAGVMWFASAAQAAGAHDDNCIDCHSTHYAKGDYIIGVKPLVNVINPARTRTGRNVAAIDALCLGCHNDDEGILPISMHTTHPTGVRPMYAKVPQKLLWTGVLVCTSCHDPHPSNANYKYLVAPTSEGSEMGDFCVVCHPAQSDKDYVKKARTIKLTADPVIAPIIQISPKAKAQVKAAPKKVIKKKKQ